MKKSNAFRHAERELSILVETVPDTVLTPFIPEILKLANKFGNSGQSGGSAAYVATAISQAVKKLLLREPITDITGVPSEWMDVSEYFGGEKVFQNTREGAIFKEGDKKPYYLDAIVFKTQTGETLSINSGVQLNDGSRITSRQNIKSFPFKPKTFYIDIIQKEVAREDGEYFIKDERQLKRVWKYYDRFPLAS